MKNAMEWIRSTIARWLFADFAESINTRMRKVERRQVIQDDELLDQMHDLTSTKQHVDEITERLKRSIYELTEPSTN